MTQNAATGNPFDFSNRTVIVTGASGAVGRAVAVSMAGAGAKVLAVDIDKEALAGTVEMVRGAGGVIEPCVADVSREEDVVAFVAAALELGDGSIHYVLNNAGISGRFADLGDTSVDEFDRVIAVNLRSVFLGMRHTLPHLREGAVIVNTASGAASKAMVGLSPYAASKHAVLGLTRTVAREVAPRGIRVVSVSPSGVDGAMIESIARQKAAAKVGVAARPEETAVPGSTVVGATELPMRRRAGPQEVANVIMFLFSPHASYVSGSDVAVDGAANA